MAEIYSSSPIYNIGSEEIKYQATGDNGPEFNGKYRIRYFDVDGTVLKIEYLSEGEIPTPPENPSFDSEYLIFNSWNYDLTEPIIGPMDVGALYDTVDNKLYLFISIDTVHNPDLTIKLSFGGFSSINWGDGTINTETTHTYASEGNYIVEISSENYLYGSGYILRNSSSSYPIYYCKKIYFPSRYQYNGYFYQVYGLELVSMAPTSIEGSISSNFLDSASIKHINLTKNIVLYNLSAFQNCQNLETISFPKNIIKLSGSLFSGCFSLRDVILYCTSDCNLGTFLFDSNGRASVYLYGAETLSNQVFYSSRCTDVHLFNTKFIKSASLYSNVNMQKLVLPETVESIYTDFRGNYYTDILILKSPTMVTTTAGPYSAFTSSKVGTLYVPDNLVDTYKADSVWGILNVQPLSQYEGDY